MIKAQGGEAFAVEANVVKDADVRAMVGKVLRIYGRMDILFNNVGFGWGTDVVNTPEGLWDKTFDG